MKRRIVFHIGTHKTGSTSVQNSLFEGRELLLDNGILYPEIAFGESPELHKHVEIFLSLQKGGREAQDTLEQVLDLFRRSDAHTMILSEEALACFRTGGPARWMP